MSAPLSPFAALALGGMIFAIAAILIAASRPKAPGNALLAGVLCAGFAAFSAVTIAAEGLLPVIANHTGNLWGVQVWWDLLFAVGIAVVLILPRARAQGMNTWAWTLFILATASIGLLAMAARLFWLENRAAGSAA